MPGGIFDSSKTRVGPVFDQLWNAGRDWLPALLALPTGGCAEAQVSSGDLTLLSGYWEPREKCLNPPVSLLSWLIRHPDPVAPPINEDMRSSLAAGDPEAVDEALRLLRTENAARAWYVFEGPTCPDALLVAHDALVVVEGKRTELTATTKTKWMAGRHQIWRHLDAAWEIRGHRSVYGMFIVESDMNPLCAIVPEHWNSVAQGCLTPEALRGSFLHRSGEEAQAIANCFLGVTTWRHVCERFGLDWRALPDDTSKLGA